MEYRGAIKSWNDDRGFGFIRPAGGGTELFFHISDYRGAGRPSEGDQVNFGIGTGRDGKPSAVQVRPSFASAALRQEPAAHFEAHSFRVWLAAAVIALAFAVAILDRASIILTAFYLVMGCAAFLAYLLDKKAARSGAWRVSELSLHLVDLAFGTAGGLLAQQVLRHKTSKPDFGRITYMIAGLHIALLIGLLVGIDALTPLVAGIFD